MQTHLLKLHGPNWEAQVFDSATPTALPTNSRTLSASPIVRSNSQPIQQRSPFVNSPLSTTTELSSPISASTNQDQARLIAHLEKVQLLVQSMERRLLEAEEDMLAREKVARLEGMKARALVQQYSQ